MNALTSNDALLADAEAKSSAGDHAAAIALLKPALAENSAWFRGQLALGRFLFREGQFADAATTVQLAERSDPLSNDFVRIQSAMQRGAPAEAEKIAEAMLEKEPGHPRAVFTLAHTAQMRGDHETRVRVLKDGLATSPANPMLRQMLIPALEEAGEFREAIQEAKRFAEISPDFPAQWMLATVLFRFGQNEAALAACDQAETHAGNDRAKLAEIELIRAQLFRIMGRRDESISMLRSAIKRTPEAGSTWSALADLKDYRFTRQDQHALTALIQDNRITPEHRSMAAFTLAKALELDGHIDKAMRAYESANRLQPARGFAPEAFSKAVGKITDAIGADALATKASAGSTEPRPIFIVGLPRSGSTLIEQILASHSGIEGTVESLVMPSVKRKAHLHCVKELGGDYLEKIGDIDADTLTSLGRRYLDESTLFHSGQSAFFTDKMPYNFEHIGLIAKILPDAVIIDARRHPLDCGLSIYKQHFAHGSAFAYDFSHIGAYYRGYLELMDHWDEALPGRVYRVQHEDLVADAETQIRALLEHVGVPFEEACLNFHETERAVRTASSEQVRQPLTDKGIGQWRQFESHLAPLKSALGTATLDRFAHLTP